MWTADNRPRYNRDKLRYPSDLTDAEWAHIEPLIPPGKPGGGKSLSARFNGVMYILRLPVEDFAIIWDGTLDRIHHALYLVPRESRARSQYHRSVFRIVDRRCRACSGRQGLLARRQFDAWRGKLFGRLSGAGLSPRPGRQPDLETEIVKRSDRVKGFVAKNDVLLRGKRVVP